MTITPKTEQQIADSKLWKKGDYDFTIDDASEKTSRAGHPMIELRLRITDGHGKTRSLTDYLLDEMPEKLRHCCAALGLLQKYESGVLSSDDFVAGRGRLSLGIEKDRRHIYHDKNVVLDYVWAKSGGPRTDRNTASILKIA